MKEVANALRGVVALTLVCRTEWGVQKHTGQRKGLHRPYPDAEGSPEGDVFMWRLGAATITLCVTAKGTRQFASFAGNQLSPEPSARPSHRPGAVNCFQQSSTKIRPREDTRAQVTLDCR